MYHCPYDCGGLAQHVQLNYIFQYANDDDADDDDYADDDDDDDDGGGGRLNGVRFTPVFLSLNVFLHM